jgi:hypothetical protein
LEFGCERSANFYLFSIASFGVGSWLIFIWQFGHLGGGLWIAFLAVAALVAAFMWAFGMWHLFVLPLVKRLGGSTDAT